MKRKTICIVLISFFLILLSACEKKPRVISDVWNFESSEITSIDLLQEEWKQVTKPEDIQRILEVLGNSTITKINGTNNRAGANIWSFNIHFKDGRQYLSRFVAFYIDEEKHTALYTDGENVMEVTSDQMGGLWDEMDYPASPILGEYDINVLNTLGWQ